jgi:general secretion pathway protein K
VRRERGFALLTVLWVAALLAMIGAQFIGEARMAVRITAGARSAAVAQAAADGAVHQAVLYLLREEWQPDGRIRQVSVGDAVVQVRLVNERRKLNPNMASVEELQSVLLRLQIDRSQATQLARAIVDWRSRSQQATGGGSKIAQYQSAGLAHAPFNHAFDSIGEVGLVVGMTPAILTRLAPLMSVYQEGDQVDGDAVETASDAVGAEKAAWSIGSAGRVMVVAVEAIATTAEGGRSARRATVRLRADAQVNQAPFQILTWEILPEE